jgi:hypothetical protein
LANTRKAVSTLQEASNVFQKIENKQKEDIVLVNLGNAHLDWFH